MRDYRYKHWFITSYMALAVLLGALPASLQAAQASPFSRWLSREAVPELQHLLSQHPRYRGQRVQLTSADNNALSEAIVTVLTGNLRAHDGITVTVSKQTPVLHQGVPGSIDELNCQDSPLFDYLLQVSAVHPAAGQDQVVLELLDVSDSAKPSRSWQWRGAFSSAERRHLKNPTLASTANGSLNAPWSGGDVNAAAQSLSREFACALRPQVGDFQGFLLGQASGHDFAEQPEHFRITQWPLVSVDDGTQYLRFPFGAVVVHRAGRWSFAFAYAIRQPCPFTDQ